MERSVVDAPTYPPAIAFELPEPKPNVLRLDDVSVAELLEMPEAWSIVIKRMPALKMMVSTPMIKPHLGNMTVKSLSAFVKTAGPEVFTEIDEQLAKLPNIQGYSR